MSWSKWADTVRKAYEFGADAAASVSDGWSCNMDHVVIMDARKFTPAAAKELRLRRCDGGWWFSSPVGQAGKRTAFAEAAAAHLTAAGLTCRIVYMAD